MVVPSLISQWNTIVYNQSDRQTDICTLDVLSCVYLLDSYTFIWTHPSVWLFNNTCDVYLGVKVFKSNHVSEAYCQCFNLSLKTYVSVSLHSVTEKACNVYVFRKPLHMFCIWIKLCCYSVKCYLIRSTVYGVRVGLGTC